MAVATATHCEGRHCRNEAEITTAAGQDVCSFCYLEGLENAARRAFDLLDSLLSGASVTPSTICMGRREAEPVRDELQNALEAS